MLVIIAMSPIVQNSKLQPDAGTETGVLVDAQLHLLMTETIQQPLQSTSLRMINADAITKNQSDDETQFRVRLRHLTNSTPLAENIAKRIKIILELISKLRIRICRPG